MKQLSKGLMSVFYAAVILELCIVALYETNIIIEGGFAGNVTAEFIVATVMELSTIIIVPVALRMIKYGAVRNIIRREKEEGLRKMALLRMAMLVLPLLVNTMCYYLFMNAAFAYMAIVLAISLVFIIPTETRCKIELEEEA